jgi:1-acyl-sn-glycerol-3-phosphate acyltransferase
LTISGDTVPKGENAILVMNHQQMPDIPFLLPFARSKGRVGDLKFFVKDALKYVPGVGWGLVFSGSVFVKRDWSRDEAAIDRAFRAIRESSMPFWLVVFAEGTRIGPHKLAREQRKAREQKRRPLRHVLMPRTRGFTAAVRALRQRADAVYDLTLAYEKGVPTMWQFVRGLARRAHLHVRRFPVDDLPRSDEELAGWLIDRFYEKDELLDRLYRESSDQ